MLTTTTINNIYISSKRFSVCKMPMLQFSVHFTYSSICPCSVSDSL